MNIIFEVTGGIGKNIIATAIVRLFKEQHPDKRLMVVASHPEVFLNNPNVDELFSVHERDKMYNFVYPDTWFCGQEPYLESNFVVKKENIYRTWAHLYNLKYNGEQPELFLTKKEKVEYTQLFDNSKPILVIHPHGGEKFSRDFILDPHNPQKPDTGYNWVRDIPTPTVNKIIEHYKDDYNIYQIKSPTQKLSYKGAKPADNPIREIIALLLSSEKRILIDSFAQHMAAALGLNSKVLWIGTTPSNFGYKIHDNILSNPYEFPPEYTLYHGFDLVEPISLMPYKSSGNIFDFNKIIK